MSSAGTCLIYHVWVNAGAPAEEPQLVVYASITVVKVPEKIRVVYYCIWYLKKNVAEVNCTVP